MRRMKRAPGSVLEVLLSLALATSLTGAPGPLGAQELPDETGTQDTPVPPQTGGEVLEEIIVSADRRDRALQDTAAAISSFSADDLLTRGITNFNTLQYSVPSLFSGSGLTRITLRGVGSEIVGPGVDPGFAVHVNGVYSARETTGLFDYFDVQRVDVLRGPQGMLWGRNSTGGAVNLITNRPTPEFGGDFDLEYGWPEDAIIRGAINMPIVEDVLLSRLAFLGHFSRGYFEIDGPGNSQHLMDDESGSVRASLRWLPTPGMTWDLIGSYQRLDNNGPGIKFFGDYLTPAGEPQDPFYAGDGFDRGLDYRGALPNPRDPYEGTADEEQFQEANVWTATLIGDWRLEDMTLTSTTGFQSTDYFLHRDQDTSSLPIQILELTDRSIQVSQELLYKSEWEAPLELTAGANYQWDRTPRTRVEISDAQNTNNSNQYFKLVRAGPPLFPDIDPPVSLVDGCDAATGAGCPPNLGLAPQDDFIDADTSVNNHVAGVFGHLSWDMAEELTLSAGLRYSYTYRRWRDDSYTQSFFPVDRDTLTFPVALQILQLGIDDEKDWHAVTWKAGVDYRVHESHLLWATVATGERAGGFNFSQETGFDEERILAVEAGIKSQFLDDRMRVFVTGFWYDWDDPQITERANSVNTVVNAPSATSYGVELEIEALPTDALLLNLSFGWLESFYDEFFESRDSTVVVFVEDQPDETLIDIEGNSVPRAPQFSLAVGGQYEFDLGRFGTLTPRVDFYWRDEISFRQFDNPNDRQEAFHRTDLRVIWRSEDSRLWAEAFVRNLEDEAVKTNQEIQSAIYRVHYYDPPINGGFRLGFAY
jgi:iron complex outermembrane receptor protein